jgi:NADP-dependent alcohol dehydrogenase
VKEFTFYNPTRIEFGSGKEDTIGAHIASAGARKVLLCYGSERIKREGLFDTVSQNLADHGIEHIELGGIVSNPVISKVREGVELAKHHSVDAILSVGGGSVLDSAKAIVAGAHYNGDVWDLFAGKGELSSALPLFAILTLAATGSEMNPYAVVTNEETHEKLSIGNDYTRLEQLNIRKTDLPAIVENVQINVKAFGIASDYPPEIVTEILMHAV